MWTPPYRNPTNKPSDDPRFTPEVNPHILCSPFIRGFSQPLTPDHLAHSSGLQQSLRERVDSHAPHVGPLGSRDMEKAK